MEMLGDKRRDQGPQIKHDGAMEARTCSIAPQPGAASGQVLSVASSCSTPCHCHPAAMPRQLGIII